VYWPRPSVCLAVPRRIPTLLYGPGCNLGNDRRCTLVVQYWADLQSVYGFRCYDNIAPNAKCQRVLVLALCVVGGIQWSAGDIYDMYVADNNSATDAAVSHPFAGSTGRQTRLYVSQSHQHP